MLPGLNHNVRFKGKTYHVQTEDSGLKKPHVTTVLFDGGETLARKRTSYADMVSSDRVDDVVRKLMMDQHKDMLRYLKSGALEGGREGGREAAQKSAAAASASPETGLGAGEVSKDESSLDEVILDFMTGESGKRRPSGGPAR